MTNTPQPHSQADLDELRSEISNLMADLMIKSRLMRLSKQSELT